MSAKRKLARKQLKSLGEAPAREVAEGYSECVMLLSDETIAAIQAEATKRGERPEQIVELAVKMLASDRH